MQETRIRSWFARNAKYKQVYLMLVPVLLYYLIFHYGPMYGASIAFKDFKPFLGFLKSPWVGFKHFKALFESYYFWRIVRNTITINLLDIVLHFPAPIILALLLNEVTNRFFKRTVQTISYMPHFVSVVVVAGLLINFCQTSGLFNAYLNLLGFKSHAFLTDPKYFQLIYVGSSIWQQVGWGSIIYLASLTGVDPQLYEQATVDGANRFKQMRHITLPGIAPDRKSVV